MKLKANLKSNYWSLVEEIEPIGENVFRHKWRPISREEILKALADEAEQKIERMGITDGPIGPARRKDRRRHAAKRHRIYDRGAYNELERLMRDSAVAAQRENLSIQNILDGANEKASEKYQLRMELCKFMDGKEYHGLARRTFNEKLSWHDQVSMTALGLTGEAGEYADLVKKCFFHGKYTEGEKFLNELGDCLWYVAMAAQVQGYNLNDVMEANIEKLSKRYPEGFSKEASEARVDVKLEEPKLYACHICNYKTASASWYEDHLSTIHPLED